MIDVRETVGAYELLPGDIVEWANRLWTCAGESFRELHVRLVEYEVASAWPAVLHLPRATSVVRVRHAEPIVFGAGPYEWAIAPLDAPPAVEGDASQRWSALYAVLTEGVGTRPGSYDAEVLLWLASVADIQEAASLTGMIARARAAGPHPDTAPQDTYATRLAVELALAREELNRLRARLDQLGGSQTPSGDLGARAGHDASDAAMAAEPAPAPAELHDVDEAVLDPDCRDGKHRSCAGGRCPCACHVEGVPA